LVTVHHLIVCVLICRSPQLTPEKSRDATSVGSAHPQTYRDYLRKYYGSQLSAKHSRSHSLDDDADADISYFSDGCVDYDSSEAYVSLLFVNFQ
jgi:hypothetical protein